MSNENCITQVIADKLYNLYDIVEVYVYTNVVLSETSPETFSDYRLTGVFRNGERKVVTYGFFNGDGDPADTGVTCGTVWKLLFLADTAGEWYGQITLKRGYNIGYEAETDFSRVDAECSFQVVSSPRSGVVLYERPEVYQFSSFPSNFMAYYEFDNTPGSHHYEEYCRKSNSPFLWAGGKGKNILGAINHIKSSGANSHQITLLTAKADVFPWVSYHERNCFDLSKLDQWFRVLYYLHSKGIQSHIHLEEGDNRRLLNGGTLGHERKLYYKEMINRYSLFDTSLKHLLPLN